MISGFQVQKPHCTSTSQISAGFIFTNVHWPKSVTWSTQIQWWGNRLHFLMEGFSVSHFQELDAGKGRTCDHFYNLPLLPHSKHARHIHACAHAIPITWNELSTSFCPSGKFLLLVLQGSAQIQHSLTSSLKLIIPSYVSMIPCICIYYSIQWIVL